MPRARCNASPSPKEQQGKGFLSLFPPNPCFPLSGTPALGLEHPSQSILLAQGEEPAGRADLKLPKSRRRQGDATRTPQPSSYSPSPGFSTARKPQGVLAGTKAVSSWRNTWHGPSAEAGHGDMDRLPSAPKIKRKSRAETRAAPPEPISYSTSVPDPSALPLHRAWQAAKAQQVPDIARARKVPPSRTAQHKGHQGRARTQQA